MEMIWNVFRQRINELKLILGLSIGMYLFSQIMFNIIVRTSKEEETTFALGSLVMVGVVVFFVLLMGTFGYATEFNLAIGMGVTRKIFTPAYYLTSVVLLLIETGVIYLFFLFERWFVQSMFPQLAYEKGIEYLFESKLLFPGILFIAALQILLGVLTLKYGKKAFWGVWVLWMAGCILPSRIEKAMKRGDDSFLAKLGNGINQFFTHLNSTQGAVCTVIVCAVVLGICFYLSRRQQVSNV